MTNIYTGPRQSNKNSGRASQPRFIFVRRRYWGFRTWLWKILHPEYRPLRSCEEERCRGRVYNHRNCYWCKRFTCGSNRIIVDPTSLRRRMVPTCEECSPLHHISSYGDQKRRTQQDWAQITEPVEEGLINTARMAEQFKSLSRSAIRAFTEGDSEFATIEVNVPAGVVQDSIDALGLGDQMYAEQRDRTTVLRRIPAASRKNAR